MLGPEASVQKPYKIQLTTAGDDITVRASGFEVGIELNGKFVKGILVDEWNAGGDGTMPTTFFCVDDGNVYISCEDGWERSNTFYMNDYEPGWDPNVSDGNFYTN